jgi:hypothetical protein
MWTAIRRVGAAALLVLAVAACQDQTPPRPGDPVPSAPAGPALTGRILVFDADERQVVQLGGSGATTLASDVVAADLSPDGRRLAYATGRGDLRIRNVDGDGERTIAVRRGDDDVHPAPGCLSWSPDGERLAFFALPGGDLYVTTLAGAATRVDGPKRERYTQTAEGFVLPQPDPEGSTVELVSELTCGRWWDDRRLVFDRVATMPGAVTRTEDELTERVPADTTTIAILGPSRLVDSPDRWKIYDRCGGHVLTFVEGDDRADRYVVDPATVSDAQLARPGAAAPAAGKLPPARAAFIDGRCDVLLLTGAASEWHPTQRWTRTTGAVQDLPPTFDKDHDPPGLDPDTVAFNPEGTAWAASDQGTLYLFDLATGGSTFSSRAGTVAKVLGWLP